MTFCSTSVDKTVLQIDTQDRRGRVLSTVLEGCWSTEHHRTYVWLHTDLW